MSSPTNMVLWFLAGIAGFAFGIFLASSLKLHEPSYIFSLASLFAVVCVTIAYKLTQFIIHRISGRIVMHWRAPLFLRLSFHLPSC